MIQARICKYWLIVLVFLYGHARSQSFKNKANIDSVAQSGFYAIEVNPQLSSLVRTDFSDLRIIDNKGNTISFKNTI